MRRTIGQSTLASKFWRPRLRTHFEYNGFILFSLIDNLLLDLLLLLLLLLPHGGVEPLVLEEVIVGA